MKITLCSSLVFYEDMKTVKGQLEAMGHIVTIPPAMRDDGKGGQISVADRYRASKEANQDDTWVWDMREMAMRHYFEQVADSDAIIVINKEKNSIPGYIGANTLLEMGVAFYQGKKIYLLNSVPEISYKEEILGMRPIVLNEDLSRFSL